MWILECDGDILKGKRVWLRPGKKYLFGRTKPEGGKYAGFVIAHKSVSRKHLTLSLSATKPGDGSRVHIRSELTVEDENTKLGTEVDCEEIRGGKRLLKNNEHVIKLGSYEHAFRIKWQPVVLSFTFPSKETKGDKDPLIPIRGRLEDLDIKTIMPYIEETTHVVAAKRNTAKGLQALINGRYIVDNSFLDALVYVTTPGNLDEPESVSPLEEDFDAHWPDPAKHLPAPGREPGQRAGELFAPDLQRKEVFAGYTFIFCNVRQFDNLLAPVTNGGGKSLYCKVDQGKTIAAEIIRFVKDAAGEKGLGEFEDGSEGKGVVVVKFPSDKGFEEWSHDTQIEVSLALGQRLIEQNEFLDAILSNDASTLRRALPEYTGNDTPWSPPAPQKAAVSAQQDLQSQSQASHVDEATSMAGAEISQLPPRRVRPRGTIVSTFRGFDDGFDPSQILAQKKLGVENSQLRNGSNGTHRDSQNDSDTNRAIDVDPEEAGELATIPQSSRKRPPPSDDEDEDEDDLLPAAAAMKRRRIQEEQEARDRGVSVQKSFGTSAKPKELPRKLRPRKEVDVQEAVRERMRKQEELAKEDEESIQQTLEGMDLEAMKSLVVVEEMEVKERTDRPLRNDDNGHASDRWNEEWNGRKNFKKFRRKGQGDQPRRGHSVIVPLVEVKKKSQGIGEEYWLESEKSKRKRKEKEELTQQTESEPFTTAKSQPEEAAAELAEDDEPEVVDVQAPRTTRLMDKTSQLELDGGPSQGLRGKRPAPAGGSAKAPKRQKLLVIEESESDSEDELKFRFKKRM